MKTIATCILLIVVGWRSPCCFGQAQYGLDSRAPIGAFANGRLPAAMIGQTGPWQVVTAFPGLKTAFEDPTFLCAAPRDPNRLYVCSRQGKIYFFTNSPTTSNVTVMLDLSSTTQGYSDCGLLGMAFHPEFGLPGSPNRGYFYIWRNVAISTISTNPPYDLPTYDRLSRFTLADGATTVDPASETILINQYDHGIWHNGGGMFFGDDGFLYVVNGDQGGAEDLYGDTQRIDLGLLSGVLRIDVNKDPNKSHAIRRQPISNSGGAPPSYSSNYFIPNDNPFVDPSGKSLEEFWAIGFRSPHRMTQDPVTKNIWLGDVGEGTKEEVDIVKKAGNYQWAYKEGTSPGFKPKPTPSIGIDTPPVYDYLHSNNNFCVIGGYVYRGSLHPDLYGQYIFGDNVSGRIFAMTYDFTNAPVVVNIASLPSGSSDQTGLSSFGVDNDNELYICRMGRPAGEIMKLVRATTTNLPPSRLSQTGIFSDLATLTPTNGVIPYDVNVPFWSSGGTKRRWIALPNNGSPYATNEQVAFSPTGEWAFPQGTVFIKHFEILTNETNPNSARRLETRLLVLDTNNSVYGVTYKWRSDQSDADLLTNSVTESLTIQTASGPRNQNYYYPSPQDCLACHNLNAHFVLGVSTRQLNCNFNYASTGRTDNQLRTWNHIGMFNPPLIESNISGYTQLNTTNSALPLSHRVRSYLDANCAFCHRPGGVSQAGWDGRFDTAITNQAIINATALNTLGIAGARVIRSGSITQSVMRVRLNALDANAMPPLAKTLIDSNGVALMDSWIVSLTNAPNFTIGEDAISAFLQVHGQQGMAYSLQGSTNLSSWSQLTTVFDNNLRRIPDTNSPSRFFRLQLPP